MKENKLKCCPFCGHVPKIKISFKMAGIYRVKCGEFIPFIGKRKNYKNV